MKNNLRILFITSYYAGGVGTMLSFITAACACEFDEVVIMYRETERMAKVPNGVHSKIIPFHKNRIPILWRLKELQYIRKSIKAYNPDIVCTFGTEPSVMTRLAMIGLNSPKVVCADRADPYSLPKIWQKLVRWAFIKANRCVFQLEPQMLWYGENVISKSCVIPNPYLPVSKAVPFSGERSKTIVSVGRYDEQKRYDLLIEAFKQVRQFHPEYELILYGAGVCESDYRKLIQDLKLEGAVKLAGWCNNPAETIRRAGCFVLSSSFEGIPNSLIEALGVGVPSVTTDCSPGGGAFLSDGGRRALLVPREDVHALSRAICTIIENPSVASELSNNGLEICKILDKKRIASMWINLFKNL